MPESTETILVPTKSIENSTRHTHYFLIGIYALAVVWGIRGIYQTMPSALDFFVPFGLAICLGWWALVDARRRRKPIKMSAQPWFLLLAGIVVPGYVIWSRGWRGAGWLVLHIVLWIIVATITMHVGGVLVFGEAWLRAVGIEA